MNLLRQILVFNAVYYAGLLALFLVAYAASMDTPSSTKAGALVAGALIAGRSFLTLNDRLPDRRERWTFTLGAFAVSLLISILLTVASSIVSPEVWTNLQTLFQELGWKWLLTGSLLVIAYHIALIYFCFGPLTRWLMGRRLQP